MRLPLVPELDYIANIIVKFKNHPSILTIKEKVKIEKRFSFRPVDESVICDKIDSLDKRKPTTYNNIPTKILVDNKDIISPFITEMYNESNRKSNFPNSLKLADVTLAHKQDERIIKGNYINVSIPLSLKFMEEAYLIKFQYTLINIYHLFCVVFARAIVHNIVLLSC